MRESLLLRHLERNSAPEEEAAACTTISAGRSPPSEVPQLGEELRVWRLIPIWLPHRIPTAHRYFRPATRDACTWTDLDRPPGQGPGLPDGNRTAFGVSTVNITREAEDVGPPTNPTDLLRLNKDDPI